MEKSHESPLILVIILAWHAVSLRTGAHCSFYSQSVFAQTFALGVFAQQFPGIVSIRHVVSGLTNKLQSLFFEQAKLARVKCANKTSCLASVCFAIRRRALVSVNSLECAGPAALWPAAAWRRI